MTEQEIIELFSDTEDYALLISERNYERTKYMELVRSLIKPGINLNELMDSIDMVFALDNAAGVQLDIIGMIVGASRELNYSPTTGSRIMDDDEFRLVIKLTIAQNTWDGTLGSLSKIYGGIFGDSVRLQYQDNQDMTVTINAYGDINTRQLDILNGSGLILVPTGVHFDVHVSSSEAVVPYEYCSVKVSGYAIKDSVIARGE